MVTENKIPSIQATVNIFLYICTIIFRCKEHIRLEHTFVHSLQHVINSSLYLHWMNCSLCFQMAHRAGSFGKEECQAQKAKHPCILEYLEKGKCIHLMQKAIYKGLELYSVLPLAYPHHERQLFGNVHLSIFCFLNFFPSVKL